MNRYARGDLDRDRPANVPAALARELPAVAGLEPCSLLDFPGHLAGVIFLQGCNFDCAWCHNRQLIGPGGEVSPPGRTSGAAGSGDSSLPPSTLLEFLAERRDFLDGIVVTGGEPCVQPQLPRLLRLIRGFGYRIKLDTNGSQPQILSGLLAAGLVDFVAMDVKAPLDDPARLADFCGLPAAQGPGLAHRMRESLHCLRAWGGAHELRTTCSPGLELWDLARIHHELAGHPSWVLQAWREPAGSPGMGQRSGRPALSPGRLREFALRKQGAVQPRISCRS